MRQRITIVLVTILLVSCAIAGEPAKADANAAFERIKQLQGEWEVKGKNGNVSHAKYELTAGGSAVVERYWSDEVPEMTTVYTVDGNRVLLTHYCMARNQPRMQAGGLETGGKLHFKFLDVTGLSKPGGGHMHDASFQFVDNDHFTAQWQYFEGGKAKFAEEFAFTRVK